MNNKEIYDYIERKNEVLKVFDFNKKNRRGSVWLYEKIGNTEMFIGSYPLLESKDRILGKYYVAFIDKKPIFVDNPRPEDFIPAIDKKVGKILELIKFAPDDFRIRERIDETYYKKVKRQVYEKVKKTILNEETGEQESIMVKEPKLDKDGEFVYEEVEVPYQKPLAITQESRDAIRIGAEYERRMQEKRANEGFWAKHGMQIATYGIMLMMVMGMIFSTVINKQAITESSKNLGMQLEKTSKELSALSPERWANEIVLKQERANAEKEAPPK